MTEAKKERLLLENKHLFRTMAQSASLKKVGRVFLVTATMIARALTHLHLPQVRRDGCVEESRQYLGL